MKFKIISSANGARCLEVPFSPVTEPYLDQGFPRAISDVLVIEDQEMDRMLLSLGGRNGRLPFRLSFAVPEGTNNTYFLAGMNAIATGQYQLVVLDAGFDGNAEMGLILLDWILSSHQKIWVMANSDNERVVQKMAVRGAQLVNMTEVRTNKRAILEMTRPDPFTVFAYRAAEMRENQRLL